MMPPTPAPEFDPERDRAAWRRRTGTPAPDGDADREIAAAIAAEDRGEYDEAGTFRPSSWRSV
jgi:hypothetical protein